jgi:hypothetical protein
LYLIILVIVLVRIKWNSTGKKERQPLNKIC